MWYCLIYDLLHHVSEYSTRNNVESKLYIPKPNIEIYRQSFQYAAPKFYNALPTDITAPSENICM